MTKYEDIKFEDLGTRRQRPMMTSKFYEFRKTLSMRDYPLYVHNYVYTFLEEIDKWIHEHKHISYKGLDKFPIREAILGTTHTLDELHHLHGPDICVFQGEYKYHRRLTNWNVQEIESRFDILPGNVLIVSYPSCITAHYLPEFKETLDHCAELGVPVHIDGAWFGQCRNFHFNCDHPAIKSVSVSLSKALGMGSQRIGIRYSREKVIGPISIMNDYQYCNVSDMWIGVEMMREFGPDYWWKNYTDKYSKVCKDFGLTEMNAIHIAKRDDRDYGIRTPLRYLIDGIFDERGTDRGLNDIERNEK